MTSALLPLAACAGPLPHHVGPVTGIAVATSGASARCSQACVEIARAPSFRYLPVPTGRAVAVAAMGDRDQFVVGGGSPAEHGWLRVAGNGGAWSAGIEIAGDLVGAVAAAPEGDLVAAGADDGAVWLWTPGEQATLQRIAQHHGACRAVLFLDRRTLVSGGRDGRLLWIDLGGGSTREVLDHTAGVECLAGDEHGNVASGALDGRVRLHDRQGTLLRSWHRIGGGVLALIADGRGWLAGTDDGRLLRLAPETEAAALVRDHGAPIHALARDREGLLLGTQDGLVRSPWPAAAPGDAPP